MKNPNRKRILPYLVEFVKFSTGFAALIAVGLVALRFSGVGIS